MGHVQFLILPVRVVWSHTSQPILTNRQDGVYVWGLTVSSSCCSWEFVPAVSAKLALNDILAFSL